MHGLLLAFTLLKKKHNKCQLPYLIELNDYIYLSSFTFKRLRNGVKQYLCLVFVFVQGGV